MPKFEVTLTRTIKECWCETFQAATAEMACKMAKAAAAELAADENDPFCDGITSPPRIRSVREVKA